MCDLFDLILAVFEIFICKYIKEYSPLFTLKKHMHFYMYVFFCTFLFMDIQYCPKVGGQKYFFSLKEINTSIQ